MHKKIMLAALTIMVSLSVNAQQGGYKGGETPPPPAKQDAGYKGSEDTGQGTVKASRDMHKDAWVTLEGNIIKHHGGDRYDFRDKTGTITIIAPKSAFNEKEYDAKDLVRISGHVKGHGKKAQIQVQAIEEP